MDKKELPLDNSQNTKESDVATIIPKNTNKIILDQSFPILILKTELSSLEAIVKFLRENKKYSYKKIAELLKRNPKTLVVSYKIAKKKNPEKFSKYISAHKSRIPFTAFNEKLSILEAICTYLKAENISYSEIARLIKKDPRTVWTVCKRAKSRNDTN